MRRIAIVGLIVAGWAAASLSAQQPSNYPWGASPREIAAQTGAVPDSQGSGTLVKSEMILGQTASVTYRFGSGGLSAVGIQWDSDRFLDVKKALDARYPPGRCDAGTSRCEWMTSTSRIRLIEDTPLGLTLLVYSEKGRSKR